ncbi:MAG: Gfo/Idh/MocA family protein [Granulosicoccus sp.]
MIRVAVFGAGIGKQHLNGYRNLPEKFSVSVVCDLDVSRATSATDGDSSIRIVRDIAQVLSDPEIDLVDICLPPHLHVPVALQALEAGKHVICEKPIARSLAEVQQMQLAIERSGKQIFPVFQYRYGLALAQFRALRSADLTGRALVASAETHWNRESDYYSVAWRGTWKGEAGGAVLGHAIHSHDLLCHILGPVAELNAYTSTLVNDIEVEDCAAISMRMESGALATSSVTLGSADDRSRLRFCFERLTAESGIAPYTPAEDIWTFTARGTTRQVEVDQITQSVESAQAGFTGYLLAIADALAGNGGQEVSFEDGRRSIEFVSAVYLSAHEKRAVKLPLSSKEPFFKGWAPSDKSLPDPE